MNNKITVSFISAIVLGILLFVFVNKWHENSMLSPVKNQLLKPTPKPLLQYAFKSLRKRIFKGSNIVLDEKLDDNSEFTSYNFHFTSDKKKVSGLLNIPKVKGEVPVVVMLRGYVDKEIYTTGMGSFRTGQAFAKAGFITLAPDFLGYGKSSSPSAFPIEERFETYTTVLNLLASINTLDSAIKEKDTSDVNVDSKKIGIWGHSNGGHIALSILEITGKVYPTVLWAPVSKPFPYSILYYTDEFEDRGKMLRHVLAEFERDYDVEDYNPTNYYDWINAPIQLHQGEVDEAVPKKWSDDLYIELIKLDKNIGYFTYTGENHNFTDGSFDQLIKRDILFFRKYFKNTHIAN